MPMKSNIAILTLHNKPYYYVASLRIRLEQTFACDDSLLKNGQSAQWPNLTNYLETNTNTAEKNLDVCLFDCFQVL